jgi:hypothetical protein
MLKFFCRTYSGWWLVPIFASTILLQAHYAERRFGDRVVIPECPWCDERQSADEDVIFVPLRERAMRLFAPADPDFLADMLWLRTCYYFGARSLTTREYPFLFHLLDLTTDLAPRWDGPFLFGAVILPTEADAVEDGLYFIEKGLIFHPDNWQLWFFKGFFHWKALDDLETASKALLEAAKRPGAPRYLGSLAATILTRAGQRELAARFIQEAMRNLDDEKQREALIQKMKELSDDD